MHNSVISMNNVFNPADTVKKVSYYYAKKKKKKKKKKGAQWLSGRVLDSRPKGRGFEPHRRHCVVVLEQDTFILA